jgi:hypothetical protein
MADGLHVLTVDWFLAKGFAGVGVGYALRVIEHLVWSIKATREENRLGNVVHSLMILPQALIFGMTLGYVGVALIAYKIDSETVLVNCAYALTAFLAFLACDLRELLRRISRM